MDLTTVETVLLALLVADAIALATLVLMQHGKGADVGAAFGSGGANTIFGSAGSASFLTKLTVWLAIGFFLVSFGLAYTATQRAAGMDELGIPQVPVDAPPQQPAAPAESDASDSGDVPPAGDVPPGDSDVPGQRLTPEPERVDSDIPEA